MNTMKTSELTSAALDWAVAKAEGNRVLSLDSFMPHHSLGRMNYSTNWAQGGPIIEREDINVGDNCPTGWQASKRKGVLAITSQGPTPLIAAMRCYVASKLGDNVEIPDQLKA